MVDPSAQSRKIALQLDIAPLLPLFTTDAAKLRQCLINLLSNAIKFSPDGSTVRLSCRQTETGLYRFEVADQGIGMSSEDIPIALAPFGQIDSSLSRKFEGTGLGLPLAQRFSELMGGVLSIASEPGQGTTVSITLPDAGPESPVIAVSA